MVHILKTKISNLLFSIICLFKHSTSFSSSSQLDLYLVKPSLLGKISSPKILHSNMQFLFNFLTFTRQQKVGQILIDISGLYFFNNSSKALLTLAFQSLSLGGSVTFDRLIRSSKMSVILLPLHCSLNSLWLNLHT